MVKQGLQGHLFRGEHHRLGHDSFIQWQPKPNCCNGFGYLDNLVNAHVKIKIVGYALKFLIDFDCDKA